jgi:hypothetical protein
VNKKGYDFDCLWSGHKLGHKLPSHEFHTQIEPLDARFFKATIRQELPREELQKLRKAFALGHDF